MQPKDDEDTAIDWDAGLRIMRETIPLIRYQGYSDEQIMQLLGRFADHQELWTITK